MTQLPFGKVSRRTILLLINGLKIIATDEDAQVFVLELYDSAGLNFENLRTWLLENTKPI